MSGRCNLVLGWMMLVKVTTMIKIHCRALHLPIPITALAPVTLMEALPVVTETTPTIPATRQYSGKDSGYLLF